MKIRAVCFSWMALAARVKHFSKKSFSHGSFDTRVALATASSGIASLLLPGGRTAHSRFRIPIELDQDSTCNLRPNDNLGQVIKAARLIVWDEATMVHRYAIEAVDRSLRAVTNLDAPFGGKVIVFGGDFRQLLPVVPHASRAAVFAASLCRSFLWSNVRILTLTLNMRLNQDHASLSYAELLMRIGNGTEAGLDVSAGRHIRFPEQLIRRVSTLDSLINHTYPDLTSKLNDASFMMSRVILCPKNTSVNEINEYIVQHLPGPSFHYLSADSVDPQDGIDSIHPVEYLNSLTLAGILPHRITLKIGCPIILLRNINPSAGLCNGTRLMCCQLGRRVIDAEILGGSHSGTRVLIPRITTSPTSITLPFKLLRRQFPVQLAFAMTINKSQGQTLSTVGLYLKEPVFSHGQLYVALSRVTCASGISVLLASNVV